MSQTEEIKSSFPSECKLAFGSSDKKQHTNLIKWTEDLEIHGKSTYGMFATIFRTKKVPEEWTTDYTPNAGDRELACSRFDSFTTYRNFTLVCISRIFIYHYVLVCIYYS